MVETVPPLEGAPDLVFTANAAVVLDGKALLARFRHPERQIEEPVFAAAFRALAERDLIHDVIELPRGIALEGAGDCLWDRTRRMFWMGCGFRSDEAAAREVEAAFGVPCLPLRLSEASYYHLDTAMCALPCAGVIYYPGAFTPAALDVIHAHVAPADRIALSPEDAARFAANAVVVGRNIVLSIGKRDAAADPGGARLPPDRNVARCVPALRRLRLLPYVTARSPLAGGAAAPKARELARRALLIGAPGVARLLLHVVVDPHDTLDTQRQHAGLAADLAVLFLDQLARRLIPVDASEDVGRHAPVGALRAVLVIDVEQDVFGPGRRFACHGSCSLAR